VAAERQKKKSKEFAIVPKDFYIISAFSFVGAWCNSYNENNKQRRI
tara:strand:- start:162 stop:299 length:138 start_codon:yes stop_codon:yes gene_type:complete